MTRVGVRRTRQRGCAVDAAGDEIDEDTEEDTNAWGKTAIVEVYVQQTR